MGGIVKQFFVIRHLLGLLELEVCLHALHTVCCGR